MTILRIAESSASVSGPIIRMLKRVRTLFGRTKYALHPRDIAWRLHGLMNPSRPLLVRLAQGSGLRVRVYPTDVIGREIYRNGCFEPQELAVMSRFLKPGMVVLDVGANLGQYTIVAAQRVSPKGQVHSFEPNSRMFSELTFNVELNELRSVCRLNKLAAAQSVGSAMLSQYPPGSEVYSSIGHHESEWAKPTGTEEVCTIGLDDYVLANGINQVDFIKMDIEGAELLALRGAKRILSSPAGPVLLIEMADANTHGFGYGALEIWDDLESHSYRFYAVNRSGTLIEACRPIDFAKAQNLIAAKSHLDLAYLSR